MFVYSGFGKTTAKPLEIGIGLVRKVILFLPLFPRAWVPSSNRTKIIPFRYLFRSTISVTLIHYGISGSALVIILNLINVHQLLSFTQCFSSCRYQFIA